MQKISDCVIESAPVATFPAVRSWGVAWTKPRCEHCLADFFSSRNIPYYLPLVSRRKAYKSGTKNWSVPLFPSYVFFDQGLIDRLDVFGSRKVADVLTPPDHAALNRELSQISVTLGADPALRQARFGVSGRKVNVTRGPMKGLSGDLVRMGGQSHLVLRINFLGIAAELAIDEALAEPAI